ncbi:vitamin K epoxide reductase family protein [Bacteroides sp. UBA939]|uniref:vitamin K epoxide reductase family protein n=1 Tax=Bacteroides sp. UBA939 TaxID=1946092 RepID=UPI0025C60756|nr:vitamin K epoxide reductase family protein [Bacteroides sp. UBA939]
MAEINNTTGVILYRYLRMLSVKVSRITISRLLDTPIGNSIRGISDAMNMLHVKNKVQQFHTYTHFSQLEVPFITMSEMDKNLFCIVTKKDDFNVEFLDEGGNKQHIGIGDFLQNWTGVVLFAEPTDKTPSERLYVARNLISYFLRHRFVIAILLMLLLGLQAAIFRAQTPLFIVDLCVLSLGILLSSAIIYKERIDERFMERVCRIGKIIDCNSVLRSKGSTIGGVALGEVCLLYFMVIYLFSLIRWNDFYSISVICCAMAVVMTFYSVIHQIFILHKGCVLCGLLSIVIWANAVVLYLMRRDYDMNISLDSLFAFIIMGCICLVFAIQLRIEMKGQRERITLRRYLAGLLNPETFQMLLTQKPEIEEMAGRDIALYNQKAGNHELMIVINPNCKNCARVHRRMREMDSSVPISLVLATNPNDRLGERVAQTVIAAYYMTGWDKAMNLLEEWYETNDIKEAGKYVIDTKVENIWRMQQAYFRSQKISKTPSVIVDNHYVPEIYSLSDFKYVLG